MLEYHDDDVWVVNPSARLRNEGKYVLAAFPGFASTSTLRLAPIESVTVSLFDGVRTCAAVTDICAAMADKKSDTPQADAESVVKLILSTHCEPMKGMSEPLLRKKADLTPAECGSIRRYRPTDYIVKPDAYAPKDLKLTFPASILWLLTNECQVNCQYCYMPKSRVSRDELLPWERVDELVREAHSKGLIALYLSGGDIMCYPHIFRLLDLMEELGFPPVGFPTKAYISPDTAARLAEYRVLDVIQLSIDSTVPEIANFLVNSPGFYDRTVESIINLRNAGAKKIGVKAVITPYNLPTIPKFYRDMRALGVEDILMATYCKSGYRHREKLFNHADDFEWLDQQLDKLRAEFPGESIFYQNGEPQITPPSREEREKTWKDRARCTAGRDNMTICANGKVIACEQMPERDEDYLGDMRVQSIEEVWYGSAMDKYLFHPPRERFSGTPCSHCEEFDECQGFFGECVRNAYIHYGTRWQCVPECPKAPEPVPRMW